MTEKPKSLDPVLEKAFERIEKRSELRSLLRAELRFEEDHYRVEVSIYPLLEGEHLEPQSMKDFIRLYNPTAKGVGTADDIEALNTEVTQVANILGNTYPTTELLTVFPNSQNQAVRFGENLRRRGFLGEITKSMVFEHDNAFRTLPDGFFYEYSGPSWKKSQRPKILTIGQRTIILSEGTPCREDMQFSLCRRPDYRVPSEDIETHMKRSPEERAENFAQALENYSGDQIRVEISPRAK